MMNDIIISTKGLAKTYGRGKKGVEAVRGID
ncbi:MAG: lipoprotein-releasing system ATP-binding protein LolD, partial [Chloroflexi bacterium]|nr:lipoprotein-releasing system ATP-binding protein LolD [Chloroflexota bacterium]